jgi:hypothetical protein
MDVAAPQDVTQLDVTCPECSQAFAANDIFHHIREAHPLLYLVWSNLFQGEENGGGPHNYAISNVLPALSFDEDGFSLTFRALGDPPINIESATNAFGLMYDTAIDGDVEYESLLALCETVGYHEVGVDDVDGALEAAGGEADGRCPICLETMEKEVAVRIVVCRHAFCDPCIREWLARHKTCPVCKREAAAPAGQADVGLEARL